MNYIIGVARSLQEQRDKLLPQYALKWAPQLTIKNIYDLFPRNPPSLDALTTIETKVFTPMLDTQTFILQLSSSKFKSKAHTNNIKPHQQHQPQTMDMTSYLLGSSEKDDKHLTSHTATMFKGPLYECLKDIYRRHFR